MTVMGWEQYPIYKAIGGGGGVGGVRGLTGEGFRSSGARSQTHIFWGLKAILQNHLIP